MWDYIENYIEILEINGNFKLTQNSIFDTVIFLKYIDLIVQKITSFNSEYLKMSQIFVNESR